MSKSAIIIADDDLGDFAPGVRLWSREISLAAPDKRCDVFRNCCREGGDFVRKGAPAGAIADALAERAERHGLTDLLGGADSVEAMIASAFDTAEIVVSMNGAAHPATRQGYPLEYYETFGAVVAKCWLIKGVIAKGETSSWIGPPGAGKSALIADLAIHIASGADWRGYRSKQQCAVVYFALERGDLVKRRLVAQAKRTDDPDKLPFALVRQIVDLLRPACVGEVIATIRDAEAHYGREVGLIVVDTYAKSIAANGGDENSAKDQNMTLANLRRVQEATGVHVALVGHTGKDETRGARGSNAHLADVDLTVQFSGDKDTRSATIIKNNDGPEGVLTCFKLDLVVLGKDDDGDEITVAILSDEMPDADNNSSRAKLSKGQRRAMELLERCIIDEGKPAPVSNDYPRGIGNVVTIETWRTCCIKGGLSTGTKDSADKAFRRAMADLIDMHRVGTWDGLIWIAYEPK
jgi:hypothetical protein